MHRGRRPLPLEHDPDETLEKQANHKVQAWKLKQTDSETLPYIVSEGRRHKEEHIALMQRGHSEKAIQDLHDGRTKLRRMKRLKAGIEKVRCLKEQYKRVSAQYEVMVKEGVDSKAKAVTWVHKAQCEQADDAFGGYVLRTNRLEPAEPPTGS